MAQEYTITRISSEDPRQWTGEHGTVYYIKVMLDGHNKPVSIGKKDPNALKVGETVFGDIIPTEYAEDKFKPASNFGGQGANTAKLEQKLDAIQGDLKLLMSWYRQDKKPKEQLVTTTSDSPTDEPDTVVDYDPEEPIDLSEIPF